MVQGGVEMQAQNHLNPFNSSTTDCGLEPDGWAWVVVRCRAESSLCG